MSKEVSCLALDAMLLALSFPAEAQQPAKMAKIGWLYAGTASSSSILLDQWLGEFRKLGYVEGKNITFEYRFADNKLDRLPALADELLRLKVDVVVTRGTPEALALKNASRTIPIVFYAVTDPVALGWLTVWRGLVETSRDSLALKRCWPASDWSYSRKLFPNSPVLRCCGIHRI